MTSSGVDVWGLGDGAGLYVLGLRINSGSGSSAGVNSTSTSVGSVSAIDIRSSSGMTCWMGEGDFVCVVLSGVLPETIAG